MGSLAAPAGELVERRFPGARQAVTAGGEEDGLTDAPEKVNAKMLVH